MCNVDCGHGLATDNSCAHVDFSIYYESLVQNQVFPDSTSFEYVRLASALALTNPAMNISKKAILIIGTCA